LLHAEGRQAPSRVLFSPFFIFIQPQAFVPRELARSEGASILAHSGSKRSRDRCSISGGLLLLPILLKSNLTASREPTHNNQFLLFLNSYVPRIVSALLGHNSREGVLVVGFWGLTPDRVPLSLGEMGGPILGCSGDLNGCQITRGGFKRDA